MDLKEEMNEAWISKDSVQACISVAEKFATQQTTLAVEEKDKEIAQLKWDLQLGREVAEGWESKANYYKTIKDATKTATTDLMEFLDHANKEIEQLQSSLTTQSKEIEELKADMQLMFDKCQDRLLKHQQDRIYSLLSGQVDKEERK